MDSAKIECNPSKRLLAHTIHGQDSDDEFIKQSILCLCSSIEPDIALHNFLSYLVRKMPVSIINLHYYDNARKKFFVLGWTSLDESPPSRCVLDSSIISS